MTRKRTEGVGLFYKGDKMARWTSIAVGQSMKQDLGI